MQDHTYSARLPDQAVGNAGRLYTADRNPDSWEGWYWGAKHVWGMETVGEMEQVTNVMLDISENSQMLLFWGCDPETTPQGLDGQMASRLCYWWTDLGIKQVYICPDVNYGALFMRTNGFRPAQYRRRPEAGAGYLWITEGNYDKEYVKTHTFGFDKFTDYVLGKDDGIPKTPEWAAGNAVCRNGRSKPWPGMGTETDHHITRQRRPGNPGPYSRKTPAGNPATGHAGTGPAR
jgi:trimethylamine-N-oxide reductase (cytochrome c)